LTLQRLAVFIGEKLSITSRRTVSLLTRLLHFRKGFVRHNSNSLSSKQKFYRKISQQRRADNRSCYQQIIHYLIFLKPLPDDVNGGLCKV